MKLVRLMLVVACLVPSPVLAHQSHWPHHTGRRSVTTREVYWYRDRWSAPRLVGCDKVLAGGPIPDDSGLRDRRGRLVRSRLARAAFQCQTPCPTTHATEGPCPGYVIDHIVPLKRGGPDLPANMQWQTVEEARAKDRVE